MAKKKAELRVEAPNKLGKEDFLEIRNNHLQMEVLKTKLSSMATIMENYERAKLLAVLQRDELKKGIAKLEIEHEDLLRQIRERTGIDVKNKTINPNTLEVV